MCAISIDQLKSYIPTSLSGEKLPGAEIHCDCCLEIEVLGFADEMSSIIPFVSLSMNINFIEKHVTLNRSDKGVDYYSSIEPDQLKNFLKKWTLLKYL